MQSQVKTTSSIESCNNQWRNTNQNSWSMTTLLTLPSLMFGTTIINVGFNFKQWIKGEPIFHGTNRNVYYNRSTYGIHLYQSGPPFLDCMTICPGLHIHARSSKLILMFTADNKTKSWMMLSSSLSITKDTIPLNIKMLEHKKDKE